MARPRPFIPVGLLAHRGKQEADMLFLPDGSRMVKCSKHGWTDCAGIGGWDDRCGKCVMEKLGVGTIKVEPMKMPSLEIFFMEFGYDNKASKKEEG